MLESDLTRAPDAAPTGKTSERVKERVFFYSFHFYSQTKTRVFIPCKISRVQPLHRAMTSFGASPRTVSSGAALTTLDCSASLGIRAAALSQGLIFAMWKSSYDAVTTHI
jgi:hypothetical protein